MNLREDPRTKEREEKRLMGIDRSGRSKVKEQEVTGKSDIKSGRLDSKKPIALSERGKRCPIQWDI